MPQLVITYWRDIPSQIVAKAGRKSEKRMLPERFQEAIDMAAMRSGAAETDAYLEEWRRGSACECDEDLNAAVDTKLAELDGEYDQEKLKQLIGNGGRQPD